MGDYYPRGLLAHAVHAHAVHARVDNLNVMHSNVTHAHAVHIHAICHCTAKPVSISMPNKLLNVKYCGKKSWHVAKISSGRCYSYFVTPFRKSLPVLITSNGYITLEKIVTRYCNGTLTYKMGQRISTN